MQCISGKLTILEWVFPTHIPGATITSLPDYIGNLLLKARERVRLVFGLELAQFILPWKTTDLVHEWSENSMTFAIASHGVELSVHYPAHPIFKTTSIVTRGPIVSQQPISGAKTLFTDASGRTGKYGFAWKTNGEWMTKIWEEKGSSVQVLELKALVASLNHHDTEDINVVSDSQYAVSLLNRMENTKIGKITTPQIAELTLQLFGLLASRTHLIWCTHMKSHTNIPGIFVEGNSVIDKAVSRALSLQGFDAARKAHDFFHQSVRGLQKEFNISRTQARNIVAACPDCARLSPLQQQGVNPRGLEPRSVWQTDITEYSAFGRLKYLHVSVDTHSHAIWATALPSSAFRCVRQHWLQAFAILGVPQTIKTDNGPSYTSKNCSEFLT